MNLPGLQPAPSPQQRLILAVNRFIATDDEIGRGTIAHHGNEIHLTILVSNNPVDRRDFDLLCRRLDQCRTAHQLVQLEADSRDFERYELRVPEKALGALSLELEHPSEVGWGSPQPRVEQLLRRAAGSALVIEQSSEHPALAAFSTINNILPNAFSMIEEGRRQELLRPAWCYASRRLALAVVHAIYADAMATEGIPKTSMPSVAIGLLASVLQPLAAWRMGKLIVAFDPDMEVELTKASLTGDIPASLLERLPHPGLYIETQNLAFLEDGVYVRGSFIALEHDKNGAYVCLALTLSDNEIYPIHMELSGSVEASLRHTVERSIAINRGLGGAQVEAVEKRLRTLNANELARIVQHVLALALYLCSEEPDLPDIAALKPTKTRQGIRYFAAVKSTRIVAGVRIGNLLRQARVAQRSTVTSDAGTNRRSPISHVRRAHWHAYRVGPGRQQTKLKFLLPILVNTEEADALLPVRRKVKRDG